MRHQYLTDVDAQSVSIHAPRVGCDMWIICLLRSRRCFNSRTPCGVRQINQVMLAKRASFNSRTPCGVRLKPMIHRTRYHLFQFTHPVWGATDTGVVIELPFNSFNSRTPCGVRPGRKLCTISKMSFNSRTPCGVRRPVGRYSQSPSKVSIHAPRVGCDGVYR